MVPPKIEVAVFRMEVPCAGNEKLWKMSTHHDWNEAVLFGSVVRS